MWSSVFVLRPRVTASRARTPTTAQPHLYGHSDGCSARVSASTLRKTEHMPQLTISAAKMVADARARIEEIATDDAIALLQDPNVVFVDLRDVRERQHSGFIPKSFHCPRGMAEFWIDPDSPYFKEIFGEDKRFIFHCASGWRSALTVATLNDMGFPAAHLKDGFSAWAKAAGPIQKSDVKRF